MAQGPLWIPWALRRPVPNPGHHDPTIHTIGSVFHVAVSWSDSLQDYFTHSSGGVESTGYIRTDGTLEQYRDMVTQCDAQWEGNGWWHDGTFYGFNSWETEGDCSTAWTDAQMHTIKRIIRWQHDEYGVPLRRCPGPFYSGYGYHCLFDAWNHSHHSCPCPSRVKQFNDIIVPWMSQGAPLDGKEADMEGWEAWRVNKPKSGTVDTIPMDKRVPGYSKKNTMAAPANALGWAVRLACDIRDDLAGKRLVDVLWRTHKFPLWTPGDKEKGTLPMDQILQQTRGYARAAFLRNLSPKDIDAIVSGVVKKLGSKTSPTVAQISKGVVDELEKRLAE